MAAVRTCLIELQEYERALDPRVPPGPAIADGYLDGVPADARCERDYRAIRVRGTLPTTLVGILLSIAEPLADAGLSIFAISTYDTDYVLVKERDLAVALEALRGAGHEITENA